MALKSPQTDAASLVPDQHALRATGCGNQASYIIYAGHLFLLAVLYVV